jgi:hypothetical protein
MARNIDKAANFVSVQLTEQKPGIYDKCHSDYGRWDRRDLAWERISHEMESEMYIYFIIKT